MKKDKILIPKGYYCYTHLKFNKNGSWKIIGLCPYWSKRENKHEQENGYCAYLEKGDWEFNEKYKKQGGWKNTKGEPVETPDIPLSFIWDMVKECNINEEE